jgi:putative tryptophan/tyrosine transport system substrate-binding protein
LQGPAGGLVSMADNFMLMRRALIISLAARNNVPAVHYDAYFVRDGGLLSYGADEVNSFHRSASYVDAFYAAQSRQSFPSNCRPNL